MAREQVIVVGAGLFGLTAARELARRGYQVVVCEAGDGRRPAAASLDLHKAVRVDYGADEFWIDHAERALEGWLEWNERCPEAPPFHQDGMLFLTRRMLEECEYEAASFEALSRRGYELERMHEGELGRRFPAFASALNEGGYDIVGHSTDRADYFLRACAGQRAAGTSSHHALIRPIMIVW